MYRRPRRDEWYGPSYGHHYPTAHWPISSLSQSFSCALVISVSFSLSLSISRISRSCRAASRVLQWLVISKDRGEQRSDDARRLGKGLTRTDRKLICSARFSSLVKASVLHLNFAVFLFLDKVYMCACMSILWLEIRIQCQ